jgi:hypothetical protein
MPPRNEGGIALPPLLHGEAAGADPGPNPGAAAPPTNTTAPPAPAAAARRPKAKPPSPLTGHPQQWACLVRDCAISLGRSGNNVKGYIRPGVVNRQVGVLGEEATAEILSLCEGRAPSGPADGAAAAVDTLTAAERERVTSLIEVAIGKVEKQDVFSKAGFRAVAEVYGSKTKVVGKISRGQTSIGRSTPVEREPKRQRRHRSAEHNFRDAPADSPERTSRRGQGAEQTGRKKLYKCVCETESWKCLTSHQSTYEAQSAVCGCWFDVRSIKRGSRSSQWRVSYDGYGSEEDEEVDRSLVRVKSEPFDPEIHPPLTVGQNIVVQNSAGFWIDAELISIENSDMDTGVGHHIIEVASRDAPNNASDWRGVERTQRTVSTETVCIRPPETCVVAATGGLSEGGRVLLHHVQSLPRTDLIADLVVAGTQVRSLSRADPTFHNMDVVPCAVH